ncbi:glucose-6-phosphate dehydrogenase (coenzyme-F420) [Nesterenkonia populi]
MSSLTLGYKASAEQFGARELVELAVAAEQHGFDSAFISDHFQPWRHTGGHAPFSLAWLTAAGERTSTIRLGTSVMTPHYRYNPAVIAQAFATLGVLHPGRVILGVGSGEALNETATGWNGAHGSSEWPAFKERFARLREAVRLIRQLWAEQRVSFEGDYYITREASIYDRPEDPVPVYIAAGGPTVAKYAGRVGDGFICTSGKGMDLYTEKLMPAVAEGAEINGRRMDQIDRMIEIKLSYDPDPKQALENTRFWAPLSLSPEQKHSITDPVQMEAAADALPIEQIASRWIVGSDPDEVAARIGEYVDAGFNHLVFHAPGQDQRRFLRAFEADLAPRLRRMPTTLPAASAAGGGR